MPAKNWIAFLILPAALLSLPAIAAAGDPLVDRYDRSTVAPGADVAMIGSDFGRRKPEHKVLYGTGTAAQGRVEIRGWTTTRIDVRLPATISPGRYWLAIFEGDVLRSNQIRGIFVRGTPAPLAPRSLPTQKVLPGVNIDPQPARRARFSRELDLGPFRADKIGTGVSRYTQTPGNPDCPDAGWEVFEPASAGSGAAYTGYAHYWNPDIRGDASDCWDTTFRLFRGMVRFHVRALAGKTIERAVIVFRARVVLDEGDSSICARKPISKMMILGQQFRAGMRAGWINGAPGTDSPVSNLVGGQIKADVTHLVGQWANGDRRNHGVVFIGRNESPFHSNNKCVVRMSDFKLDVDYHD